MNILFTEEQIQTRVKEMASQISKDYEGKELILICVLKAAFIFASDLIRNITIPCTIDFVKCSSYGNNTTSSKEVLLKMDCEDHIAGKHVLIVDTIVDSGYTLNFLHNHLLIRKPHSLGIVVLVNKAEKREKWTPVTYKGFDSPDLFLTGYGTDASQQQRGLPYICYM